MHAVALFYFAVVTSHAKTVSGFGTPFNICNIIPSKVETASYKSKD